MFERRYQQRAADEIAYNTFQARIVKFRDWGVFTKLNSNYSGYTLDFKIGMALYNGKVYMLFKWNSDAWRLAFSFDNTYGQIVMVGSGTACELSGLTMSETVPTDVVNFINTLA